MKGFALIEVLVALLILSLGLLGIAGMQLSALQYSQDAYWQSLATTQLTSLLERLRANQTISAREHELALWSITTARLLPHGEGSYVCQLNVCVVHVQWIDKQVHTLSLSGYL